MKKVFLSVMLLMLVGCIEKPTIDESLIVTDRQGNMVVTMSEVDLPDETYELMTTTKIQSIFDVDGRLGFSYQIIGDETGASAFVMLNEDYTIDWTYNEEIAHFWSMVNNNEILLRTYNETDGWSLKLFDIDGNHILSTHNLIHLSNDYALYNTYLQKRVDGYYGVRRHPDESYGDTYQIVKLTETDESVLYEFEANYLVDSYILEDDTFVISYRDSDDESYTLLTYSEEDGAEILYENLHIYYTVKPLVDGFLLNTATSIMKVDFDLNELWVIEASGYSVFVEQEIDDYIVFRNPTGIYKVYNDGTYELTEVESNFIHMYSYFTFSDGSYVKEQFIDEVNYLVYYTKDGEIIWQYEVETVHGVAMYENNIYVSISETELVRLSDEGKEAEVILVDGVIQFFTDDGNYMLKAKTDDFDEELMYVEKYFYLKEVTESGSVLWESNRVMYDLEIFEIENDTYGVGARLSITCFYRPVFNTPPSYKEIYIDGELAYDFDRYFGDFLFELDGVIYYRTNYLVENEDRFYFTKLIAFDEDYSVIKEYELIYGRNGVKYALKDGKMYIIKQSYEEAQ